MRITAPLEAERRVWSARSLARTNARLWLAVLAGPAAWLLDLNLGYALVRVACSWGSLLPLHLVSGSTLLMAAAGGWIALAEWRVTRGVGSSEQGTLVVRSSFMAALGLLLAALFGVVILAQWITHLFLDPCMGI